MEVGQDNTRLKENREQPWIAEYFTPEVIAGLSEKIATFENDEEYLSKVRNEVHAKIGEMIAEKTEAGEENKDLRSLRYDLGILFDTRVELPYRTVDPVNVSSIKFLNRQFHMKLPSFRLTTKVPTA